MDELTKCPKCKTRTLKREGEELVCSQCHEHFPAPSGRPKEEPPKRNYHDIYERHRFYESHRTEIIQDLLTMGRKATRNKWGISGSTLPSLEKRWLAPDQRAMLDSMAVKSAAEQNPGTSGDHRLPQLPEFSSSWDPTVQLQWFEAYKLLIGGK